ncbi:unnamed protein product [Allacma fusca]|uniref:Uncharacterized protein n=1 Tax=Allacma fusca TaxID=39272 RepID=A0A8J2KLJ3_9HEXA|nr:unnamed protein product [Allacma fusca]
MMSSAARSSPGLSPSPSRMSVTDEDRIGKLESKVTEMQICLEKYRSRFKDQKLFCKYVAEYLLHKFGFNIWLRLEMVKAAGEGGADSDDEGLLPRDLPSIFQLAVNKSSKERQLRKDCSAQKSVAPVAPPSVSKSPSPAVTNSGSNGVSTQGKIVGTVGKPASASGNSGSVSGNGVCASEKVNVLLGNSVSVSGNFSNLSRMSDSSSGSCANVPANSASVSGSPANFSRNQPNMSGISKSSGNFVPSVANSAVNGSISNGVVNRSITSSVGSHRTQVLVGNINKRRTSSNVSPGDGKPAKLFLSSTGLSHEKKSSVNSTCSTGQIVQIKPVESTRHVETNDPILVINTGAVQMGSHSMRGIRVFGNVVELPEADISGLSKETEDADPLFDLDFGIPEVQDCSSYSTHPMTSQSTYVTTGDNNHVEIVHDDYNDPSIEIKYEESYKDSSTEEEMSVTEVSAEETTYQIIAPPKLNQRAAARCRRSSPFDMNWLYQMKKYQQNIMPYITLIKRDEFRQWFEYLPNEKPEESRYRCRLCYKYMQTYGIPRSNWGPVESERGQLKRTECDNRNVINSHGKKKSHLEIMKRLQIEGNPEVGFVDRFDKTMKKQLIESLEKDF